MEKNGLAIMDIGLLFALDAAPEDHKVYHQQMRSNFGIQGGMNMEDLISRRSAIEAAQVPDEGCSNRSERHGIIFARVEARRAIQSIPSVPAVPLDKLCEFLGEAVTPCILLNSGCPYNEATRKDCDSCRAQEAWKIMLSKWMEAQDASPQ